MDLIHLPRLFAVALLAFLLVGCDEGSDTEVIKLAHGLNTEHPVHAAMVYMAERLEEKSNGTMRIDIYPSEQLGSEREAVELLQIGSLGMTKVSAAAMEGFAPAFKIFSVPYLFRDREHYFNVLEGEVGREILLSPDRYWLRGLTYYDAGSRSFYTKNRPVNTPADLQGQKIRTMESPSAIAMVNQLGGSATPISWGELYSALQQGVVDGAENNPPSFYLSRHYEVARYYVLDEHTSPPDVLLISTRVWDDLTPQQQTWLQEAADESAQHQKVLWEKASNEALQQVQAAGVEVIRPDKAPFVQQVEPLYEIIRTAAENGDAEAAAMYEMIQRIRAVP